MTSKALLLAVAIGVLLLPAGVSRAEESDTVRVTRERDAYRAQREKTLVRRDQAREASRERLRARSAARRQADVERRARILAVPTNRLSDRLIVRPKPLGKASRPR